ncbi:tetratricopeptide repeat protein [Fuerstiella marisgermanici]|uniref:Putative PEP-CTERM system TPR-repeat lipoprotein n=1 Tax=Fuerstiella marisgermanici TaxID=1891926 RepID=A0A1P8WBH5_9PLAN|nr:tetratricopeptide repeat protein [Fuerstiella marisgermanici]APZ91373.1 putative PEP-CTERM system TPR-repeat lipoprotein [Fuerstiella marisgermanici]
MTVVLAVAAWIWTSQHRITGFERDARKAVLKGDWTTLKTISEDWLRWDPATNDGKAYYAEACVQLEDYQAAVDALHHVSEDYHGYLSAQAMRAEILFSDLNQPLEAIDVWNKILTLEPAADVPHQRLIYWYAMTLQRQKLVEQIIAAAKHKAEPREAYAYLVLADDLNFSDGLATVTRWLSQYPDNQILEVAQAVYAAKVTSSRSLPKFGTSTVMPGDRSLVDRCHEKYPEALEPLALLIELAIFDGDSEKVRSLLGKAPANAENDGRFWRFRGWLLTAGKSFEAAATSLRRAIELGPWDWRARLFLADVLRKQGKNEEAATVGELAMQGKTLHGKLLQSPNARDLSLELVNEIYAHLEQTGPDVVQNALASRLNPE